MASEHRRFPTSAGILLGLGLGGFFDGIVLHQLLQWHRMATSAGYPADSVENLRFNTLLDGLFHAGTYVFVVLGLVVLWRTAHKSHLRLSGKMLLETMLMGFGIFNLVEGIRLDTTSLRGLFNQQIHGSKRSLRSVEDFTEFEQRTAYFNGDHVSATRKGVNLPDRTNQVAMMAQMQNIIDFPPAPKLDPFGRLDPALANEQELEGERVFMGKGRCAQCHLRKRRSWTTTCTI
jgi:uncharacterized membrane protein